MVVPRHPADGMEHRRATLRTAIIIPIASQQKMAPNIPEALRQADIARFANRAAQLESYKPVISYWCKYHILDQILARKLHSTGNEALQYTTSLMDELEKFKAENSSNDTVMDDVASQAYVEQFGLETLQRAENAMRANKSSLQTADTLQAAATFLELNQIWGKLEPDVAQRIKFAKYHALRIAKAIKAGEDPNLSNPKTEESPKDQSLNPSDPDVQALALGDDSNPLSGAGGVNQATVRDVPEEGATTAPPAAPASATGTATPPVQLPGVMDLETEQPQHRRQSRSLLPDLPAAPSELATPASYTARSPQMEGAADAAAAMPPTGIPPVNLPLNDNTLGARPRPGETPPPTSLPPTSFPSGGTQVTSQAGGGAAPTSRLAQPPTADTSLPQTPQHAAATASSPMAPVPSEPRPSISAASGMPEIPTAAAAPPQVSPPQASTPAVGPAPVRGGVPTVAGSTAPPETMGVDDNNISEAQKHARWAVSALQFDDVATAVKELRTALGHLNAQ
ncbi:hypothetical protein KEM55_005768 [Ascosphaera atra]|nr:hypothetical protein KEM55_005768 [Ascosphaera atra]